MKYTLEIDINLPLEKVTALFGNPENSKYWQPGFQSAELISGTPGQTGAKSKLLFKMGKNDIEMLETINLSNLPDEYSVTYESKLMLNTVNSKFIPIGQNKTKCVSHQELRFKGMMRLIGFLFPNTFKKQSMKYMKEFKSFAEAYKD